MAISYLKQAVVLQQNVSNVREKLKELGYKELFPSNGDYTLVHHSYFMTTNNVKENFIDCGRDNNKFINLVKQGVKEQMGIYDIEEFVTMEYYNIEQIVRIEVWKAIKAYNWRIKPLKSIGFIDSLFDRNLWKLNQKYPLYLNTTTYEGWFTPLDIKEHLCPEYYFDEETLQVKEYPTVRLYLVDGTKTIMHFRTYQSALDYAEKLVNKSEHLIQLDKI